MKIACQSQNPTERTAIQERGSQEVNLADTTQTQQNGGSSSGEFVDCEDYPAPQDVPPHQQQNVVDTNDYAASQDIHDGPPLPEYLHQEDDQQDQSQISASFSTVVKPPATFTTSFTSSFTSSLTLGLTSGFSPHSYETRFKRSRHSQIPPLSSHRLKKYDSAQGQTGHRIAGPAYQSGAKANITKARERVSWLALAKSRLRHPCLM